MNTKSNMYHNKIDKQFTNNSIFYSTLEKNNKVFESNDIRKKIQNIFNSNDYIYRVNVHILLDSGLITRKVIGIYNNNLVTIDNEYIPISNIKDIYIAANPKDNYQIEFYVLESVDTAKTFFSENKTRFSKEVGKNKIETKSKKGNSEKYTVTSLGQYRLVSRIENTVIYLDTRESNKKKVDEILKELGY